MLIGLEVTETDFIENLLSILIQNSDEKSEGGIDLFFELSEENPQLKVGLEVHRILGQNLVEAFNGLVSLS